MNDERLNSSIITGHKSKLMKFCPTCETRYDEEILRFCTKDGTPLIDENQPNFTEMPSAGIETPDDGINEETLVSYKPSKDLTDRVSQTEIERTEAPRIVIPMNEQKKEQQVRSRTIPPYQPLSPKSNTGKTVALTILGTLGILALGLGLFYFLRTDDSSNNKNTLNVNTNPPDANLNTNLNLGGVNYNVPTVTNLNVNTNFNLGISNLNTNIKTPTPTATSTPTPKPSPSATANINSNTGNLNINSAPPPSPKPSLTPKPSITATPTPKVSPSPTTPPSGRPPVNAGVLNGRAVSLPKPAYPQAARQARANGQVAVQVLVDEEGNVMSAKATTGNPLLRQSAEAAARQTRFNPVTMNNQPVKAVGILLYNFIN